MATTAASSLLNGSAAKEMRVEEREESEVAVFGPKDYLSHFDPEAYLQFYYSSESMSQGTRVSLFVLPIFAHILAETVPEKERSSLVDMGAGPTIYSAICFRDVVSRIYLTDYAQHNLDVLESWVANTRPFDWSSVVKVVARNEGSRPLSEEKIGEILENCRKKITNGGIFHANVTEEKVIPFLKKNILFDVMVSVFCLEAACSNFQQYKIAMKNMTSLIRPRGRLILGSVTEDTTYISGMSKSGEATIFHLLHLTEAQILESLEECDFDLTTMRKYALSNEGVLFLMVSKKDVPPVERKASPVGKH
ncbi:hypothetical protein QR680_013641 [Steinernema hermaphroditum]|uniref:NNMT/PNMT/TEMT family protein n=1 Tax=Steinernema hermaphroditum TaxID=289476 RepID=A0AA39M1V4_9BILA|nr:hypothetical protein QR680_013641 [Steinernema hermaphroditum]